MSEIVGHMLVEFDVLMYNGPQFRKGYKMCKYKYKKNNNLFIMLTVAYQKL